MKERYINFVRAVSINLSGRIGVILTTSSFITFLFMELLRILGILTNSYIGLINYLILPSLFIIGLILIPTAWIIVKKKTNKTTEALLESRFDTKELSGKRFGSRVFRMVMIFTIINISFLLIAGMRTLKFMDEAEFCGTACHSVMNPEWSTYQVSPHSRVACVECHVGEGAEALISSKLNGAWQMISATFDLYERPIPTPVHQLRPSRETCEKCHWPEKFYGSKLKSITHYKNDEFSTPQYTTLVLKIDTGEEVGKSGIHWHIGKETKVRYSSLNDEREEIIWVEVINKEGRIKRFTNRNYYGLEVKSSQTRIMDCVDCHNRATHIYEDPETAVEKRLGLGQITRSLPFIKRESLGALYTFTNSDMAENVINNRITNFYRKNYPILLASKADEIHKTIQELHKIYSTNIHFEMNIDWNTYPDHIGHKSKGGCFRCHNNNLIDEDGKSIKDDCTLCHSILAYDSESPYEYLRPIKPGSKDSLMHLYLSDEFLRNYD